MVVDPWEVRVGNRGKGSCLMKWFAVMINGQPQRLADHVLFLAGGLYVG